MTERYRNIAKMKKLFGQCQMTTTLKIWLFHHKLIDQFIKSEHITAYILFNKQNKILTLTHTHLQIISIDVGAEKITFLVCF